MQPIVSDTSFSLNAVCAGNVNNPIYSLNFRLSSLFTVKNHRTTGLKITVGFVTTQKMVTYLLTFASLIHLQLSSGSRSVPPFSV